MPTATKFMALGAGNGFTSCLAKVDISDAINAAGVPTGVPYDYWTTLSGWSAVNEPADKAASIAESLRLAMKLWWNLNSVSVDTFHNGDNRPTAPKSISSVAVGNTFNDLTATIEPINRICETSINSYHKAADPSGSSARARILVPPVRLYDGEEFIGYGANKRFADTRAEPPQSTFADVRIGGYGDDGTSSFFVEELAYVELDGMHFVCRARADAGLATGTVDAASLHAESSRTIQGTGYTTSATITSLDFYTY
tara:strand:+ start:95 stop:859 length:765 start_codon:yes stop_codon:yes gene_type:complete